MYKALLVDDEPRILAGLRHLIQWEDHGIEIAGQANNGEEALHALGETGAHILLTDIKMPDMDGLELIHQAKRNNRSLKCIILSGYGEFALVKEAAQLGIENYLLKPVVREELSLTLLNIVEKLEAELAQQLQLRSDAMILRNNILSRWLSGSIGQSDLHQRAELLQLDLDSQAYMVCLVKALHAESDNQAGRNLLNYASENICGEIVGASSYRAMTLCEHHGYVALIVHGTADDLASERIRALLEECAASIRTFLKRDTFVAIGSLEEESRHVPRSYAHALDLMEYSLILSPNAIVDYRERSRPMPGSKIGNIPYDRFTEALAAGNPQQAAAFVDQTFRQLRQTAGLSPVQAQHVAIEMLHRMLSFLNTTKLDPALLLDSHDSLFVQLLKRKSLDELSTWLQSLVGKTVRLIESEDEKANPMLKRIVAYIESNYADNLSLKTIAASFHVNPAYLGQLFIKEKGDTFSNLLNRRRIEKAMELLGTTDLDLNEIAQRVGYVNASYFSSLFKKMTGIYPTKYRLNSKEISPR